MMTRIHGVLALLALGGGCHTAAPPVAAAPAAPGGGAAVMPAAPAPSPAPAAPRPVGAPVRAAPAADSLPPPGPIPVTVRIRTEWVRVPPSPGFPGSASVVAVRRAVDPVTGKPYDAGLTGLGGDPRRLRRGFRLPQAALLLGEPLLVELRVEVPGGHGWRETIGGNYRGRGRDDNVIFVLRHADGRLVADAYPGPAFSMGGLSTRVAVTAAKPFSYHLAVQRYAALIRPGTYDLYCVHLAHGYHVVGWRAALEAAIPPALRATHRLADTGNGLVEIRTGRATRYSMSPSYGVDRAPSPLAKGLPPEVARRLGAGGGGQIADLARFRIVVTEGGAAARRRMVARWTRLAGRPGTGAWPTPRARAAREAIWFARQDDFLPLLGRWLRAPGELPPQDLHGLAMRPSPAATRLLLGHLDKRSVHALHYLPRARIRDAVPALIGRLTAADAALRSGAEYLLGRFTGQRFGRTWDGYRADRPTLAEGRRMQPLWTRWWRRARGRFVPPRR